MNQQQLGDFQTQLGRLQQGQAQNCVGSYQSWHQCTCTTKYVYADISIDRAENGFLITIKGKRFVAICATDIQSIIEAASK